jgi:hypothetical protein
MHWFVLAEKDAATETVIKTPLGRRRTHDLLLPRLLSGDLDLATSFADDSTPADFKPTLQKP